MNTGAAATQAGVTIATIRTWCRRNVIAATKQAGRWIINATSLKTRLRIGRRLTRLRAKRLAPTRRRHLLNTLRPPALTGSPRQIAWAEQIRADRIEQAITIVPTRRGPAYTLAGAAGDPLGITYIPELTQGCETYTTLSGALAALETALTHGARRTASWWINTRHQIAPL
jgi:hypothetical protein